jgi:hypothetical protein
MANYLDTLLRDSAEGEHFSPTEEPTFPPAVERARIVPMRDQLPEPRALAVVVGALDVTPTRAGDDFVTALLRRVRPKLDPDRFTRGLGLVASESSQSDPFPVLF